MSNDLNKQATIAAIERINAVEGFDPSVLAVDYSDLSSNETRRRLPVMSQMAWFRLKYPEAVSYTHLTLPTRKGALP